MLVLSRYRDESIYIGDDIVITVVDIRGDRVRIGVQAPSDVTVHRQEVYEAIKNGDEKDGGKQIPSAPLGQGLNKQRAKVTGDAKGLPVSINTTVGYGGLTSDDPVIP